MKHPHSSANLPTRNLKRRAPLICAASIALFAASHLPSASAATVTWTGAGGDANWTTAANWGGTAPVAGDALTFDGTTQLTDTNNFAAATTFLGITFNAGAGSFVLSGNSIDSTGGIVNNSLNLQTVNLDLIFASTHTLNSITGGTMVIGGVISGAGGTTKTGGGTVTLTRANTYTGATAVNAGTLKLDFAAAGAPATNIISASSALQMGGGTLSIQGVAGGASTQTMASTTFNAGLSAITVTPGAAGTASLALGNIVHNTNAAVRFGTTGTVTAGTVSATTGGLLGLPSGTGGVNFATAGYATYGLDDFAAISAGTIVGGISVAGFYQNTYGANFDMLANTTLANGGAQRAANVVRWNTPTATTLTGGTSNLVTFTGALITPNMGANNAVFNTGAGGVWQVVRTTNPNGAQQGTIWQNNTLGYFNVSIPIVDGREGVSDPTQIVKAGAGTAVFSGVNTYTGRTSIYEGALMIGADNNLGAVADPLTISGGTLLSSATFALSTTRAITVGGGGTGGLAATTGNTLTIGSVVGGTGEVAVGLGTVAGSGAGTANTTAVLGDGKVVLTAANTYSGGTSVNAGTLNVNGINALGGANYGGLKIAGGTLQYATTLTSGSDFSTGKGVNLGAGGGTIDTNGNAVSYAFGIAGAGGLTKIGNNTLTLSAAGSYTGGTVINGGTLKVAANSATGTGAVTVNSGGTLAGTGTLGGAVTVNTGGTLDPGASVGTLTVPGLTLGVDALLRFEFNISPANDQVVVTGLNGLTLNGGKFSLFAEGTATAWGTDGSYNLFSYNGAILGTGTSALTVINGAAGHSYTFGSGGGFVTLTVATVGVISNWALATGGTWNLAGNWSNGVPDQISATANLGAALGAAGIVTLDGGRTVGGLTFSNANSYTVASGTGGSLTFQKSSGSADAMVLSGSHTISAPVVLASNLAADIAASSTLNVSGQVSGAQSLTKRGNGTLVLGSANLYSLGTTLEAGTLELGDANALGTAALSVTGSATVRAGAAALAPAYNVSLVGAVTATVDSQANTFTLTGIVSNTAGNGALTKTGSGTLVLAGTNTYGGATTVSAGTLSVGDVQDGGIASSIGQSSAVAGNLVVNGGTLSYTGAGASTNRLFTIGTAGGTIAASGSGALNFTDVAPLTLTGADTARTLTLTGTSGASNTLFPALGDNGLGATSLTKSGAGTWQLSGTNTFTGQTVISGGTLALGHALALQNSTLNYNNQGGALSFGPFTAVTFGNLTGGQLLALSNDSAQAVTLTVGNAQTTTFSGALTDGVAVGSSLTKVGGGTLNLTGANAYTGTTTVNGGTLTLGAAGIINGGAVQVNANSTLNVNGGTLTASALSNVANAVPGPATFNLSSGSATFNGGLNAVGNQNQNWLINATGGTLTAASLSLGRSALSYTVEPTAGATATGLYINGATVSVAGGLTLGNGNGTNSSVSVRIDSGSLTVGGTTSIGLSNGGRWSVIDVNGGTFTSTDTVNGVFIGAPQIGNAELLIRAGTATVEGIKMGQAASGTSVVNLTGGSLYLGSGGIVQNTAVLSVIKLGAGILGAKADWSSLLDMQLLGIPTIKAADAADVAHGITLGGILSGTGVVLTKTGNGVLTLNGLNTFTGATLLSAGTLNVNADTALGDAGNGVTLLNGAVLQAGGAVTTNTRIFSLGAGGGTIDTNGNAVTLDAGSSVTGSFLTKTGAGTLTLNGVNTYTVATVITGGTVNANANAALGDPGAGVSITNGAILQAGGALTTGARTIALGGVLGGKIDTNGNAVTLAAGSTVTGTVLTKIGAGTLTLAGTQTYATLNANGGVTNVNSTLGTGTSTINANAAVNIKASQTLAALTIADGVEVTFGDGLAFDGGPDKGAAFGGGTAVVPEPGSVGLLLIGALGLLGRRRRS